MARELCGGSARTGPSNDRHYAHSGPYTVRRGAQTATDAAQPCPSHPDTPNIHWHHPDTVNGDHIHLHRPWLDEI